MNTTLKGNKFEDKSFKIIEKALKEGRLGIDSSVCKIYKKKEYYSTKRGSNIVFDISIEVVPHKAKKPTLVYIIECKDYAHKVPVDDIEEFESKISGLMGFQTKGVFITSNSFQQGSFNLANNKGFMLIEVNENGYNIVLHKKNTVEESNNKSDFNQKLKYALYESFLTKEISGLKNLSKENINTIGNKILDDYYEFNGTKQFSIELFKSYLSSKYGLTFEIINSECESLGSFIPHENKICLNKNILNTSKYSFTLFHEISHFFLHKDILVNKNIYDCFSDSEFNFIQSRYVLNNPKNWIEWQANYLASCLLLPEKNLKKIILEWQTKEGIRNKGTIFLDKQKVNKKSFAEITDIACKHFEVSKTVLKYRLIELGILVVDSSYTTDFEKSLSYTKTDEDKEEIRRKTIERANSYL